MNDQVDSKTLNKNRVLEVVRAQLMLDSTREIPTVDASSTLESLGLDSLDQVEIVLGLEDEFCIVIDDEEAEKFTSVKAIFDHIAARDDLA